jgi:hypothetical protein
MTAKRCGSAPHDGSDHLELLNPEVMFVDEVVGLSTENIGHLEKPDCCCIRAVVRTSRPIIKWLGTIAAASSSDLGTYCSHKTNIPDR